jgi:D-alanine-D-alanine ligase
MEQEEGAMSQVTSDGVSLSNRSLTIVVLLGGWSTERDVSLDSGRAVINALRSRGHDVRELDPAAIDILTYPWVGVDAAFIALHGSFGEDGTVQSLLDDLRIPYTGSGPAASQLAMNKSASKQRFIAHGLPTPTFQTVHVEESDSSIADKAAAFGFPLVVKPNAQGSSVGVTIVDRPEQLVDATHAAFRHDPLVLLETYIPGRELTVAVLDRRPLPPIEIQPARPFYDYHAKYQDDATDYVFEIDLPPAVLRGVESVAVSAVESLGCCGVARVDLRLDGEHRPWLLEVNTIPGFTDHSLVPKAAARAEIGFAELCEQLIAAKLQTTHSVGSLAA